MTHAHAVVWIDHRIAKIFAFNQSDTTQNTIRHSDPSKQIHHKAGSIGSGHVTEDEAYLDDVTRALHGIPEILILGPSHVKWQLRAHINLHAPEVSKHVLAVLHADHPSDPQIVSYARKYFSHADRMTPQLPMEASRD